MPKNIIVTGGSGVAGKWVVKDLLDHGHQVLNLDRTMLRDSAARTLITDLTDAGQVFNALASKLGRARWIGPAYAWRRSDSRPEDLLRSTAPSGNRD
jgi:nucleoside-diphosphate-sugar epimerase